MSSPLGINKNVIVSLASQRNEFYLSLLLIISVRRVITNGLTQHQAQH